MSSGPDQETDFTSPQQMRPGYPSVRRKEPPSFPCVPEQPLAFSMLPVMKSDRVSPALKGRFRPGAYDFSEFSVRKRPLFIRQTPNLCLLPVTRTLR